MKLSSLPRSLPALLLSLLVVPFTATGCLSNQHGMLAASPLGDVSNPVALRAPASAELGSACAANGTASGAIDATIRRQPYLQQVTEHSALVTWTTASERAARVELTLADGTRAGTFEATVDPVGHPSGARQLKARLTELEPDTIYCYRIEDGGPLPLVPATGLRTAPAAGSGRPVRYIAFGDAGDGGSDQYALAEQLATVPFDLMLPLGDNAYSSGTRDEFERNFFAVYQSLFRNLPVIPVSGNHEYETDGAAPFRELFALPDNGGEHGRGRWFSFDRGDVHFVGLDTEQVGSEQAAWLERDLSETRLPWKIVYAHKPPYSSGEHGSDDGVRGTFSPIFARHGVALVLSGHDHHYERTTPQAGVTYVVSGGGGAGVRSVGVSEFTAYSVPVIHFVYVEIEGAQLALHAIDATGVEFDSVILHRPEEGLPVATAAP